MLKIGDFARLCHVSTQTIRYYDSVGILPADRVDAFTGYRYYHPDKVETFRRIRLYQEIGFSLEDIKLLLSDEPGMPLSDDTLDRRQALLADKRRALQKELNLARGKLARLENITHERHRLGEQEISHALDREAAFENDEAVLGSWELVGRLDPADGEEPTPDSPLAAGGELESILRRMVLLPGGQPWWMIYWTRGTVYFMLAEYRTVLPCPYTLREREDGRYMILRVVMPASVPAFAEPHILLFRQTENRAMSERESHTVIDRTDLPLRPDPRVLGRWEGVDFLQDPAAFDPHAPQTDSNGLWIVGLTFTAQNICIRHLSMSDRLSDQALTYTRTAEGKDGCDGVILRPGDGVAEAYFIRSVEDRDYLFVQHKSGDYCYGGQTPAWYVFRRPIC